MITAVKFYLYDTKRPIVTFYLVIYTILLSLTCLKVIDGSVSGFENSSIIFLFVAGICCFRTSFYMFLQNSQTRKILFLSFFISYTIISLSMAFLDTVNMLIFRNFFSYHTLLAELYQNYYSIDKFTRYSSSILWSSSFYLMASSTGFFISCLYYRMSRFAKILVSVGTPVSLFIVLPNILFLSTKTQSIADNLAYLINVIFGFESGNILLGAFVLLMADILIGGFSYILVRKSTIKE